MVRVTLTGATPAGSQRIKADANTVEILIQENDMPGGIFEFGPAMPASFRVEVGPWDYISNGRDQIRETQSFLSMPKTVY